MLSSSLSSASSPYHLSSPCHLAQDNDFTIGSNSLLLADSTGGGMFKDAGSGGSRGRHHIVSSRRIPLGNVTGKFATFNAMNAARVAAIRCFNGNRGNGGTKDRSSRDKCSAMEGRDGGGGGGGRGGAQGGGGSRLTRNRHNPVLDTPLTQIMGNRVVYHPELPRRPGGCMGGAFGNDAGVVIKQLLFPVVIVFRRTICSPNSRGQGSLGLPLKGLLFRILSFWMDLSATVPDLSYASSRRAAVGGGQAETVAATAMAGRGGASRWTCSAPATTTTMAAAVAVAGDCTLLWSRPARARALRPP
jgi:hypothetical protein